MLGITVALGLNLHQIVFALLFVLALLANATIAVVLVMLWRQYSRATVDALPVIVTAKQHQRYDYSGAEGGGGERDDYWLTLQFEDGAQSKHAVSEDLFLQLHPPCAGVAHVHSYEGSLLRYDAVLEKL